MIARAECRGARVEAQAKINLFLRVLEREPSGYHRIETLFQRIALADTVTVRSGASGRTLTCDSPEAGPVEKNLAWRAANAFAAVAGWPDGFAVEIEKRIPVGGGLGGGSADAAATLRALNAMAPQPLAEESLATIAFGLGADVPYLLSDLPLAFGAGRGERLHGAGPLPERPVVLLVPAFGVSSRDAFSWLATARGDATPAPRDERRLPSPLSWPAIARYSVNELEAVVFARHPGMAAMRGAIEDAGAGVARMSGSGSTLFGVFDPPEPTRATADPAWGIDSAFIGAKLIETTTVDCVAPVALL